MQHISLDLIVTIVLYAVGAGIVAVGYTFVNRAAKETRARERAEFFASFGA